MAKIPQIGETISASEFNKLPGVGETISAEQFANLSDNTQTQSKDGIFSPIAKRGEKLGQQINRIAGPDSKLGYKDVPEVALNIAGQGIGAGYDVAFKGLSKITPSFIKDPIKSGIQKVVGTQPVRDVLEKVGEFSEDHPRATMNIESGLEIASLVPVGKSAQVTAKIGKGAAKTTSQKVSVALTKNQISKLDNFIDDSLAKGVRPSTAGKNTAQQLKVSQGKAREAVFTILDNKNNLKFSNEAGEEVAGQLPNNLREFAEAIGQTKKAIFNKYDDMAKATGVQGRNKLGKFEPKAKVSLDPIVKELNQVASNKVISDQAPDVVSYATTRAETLARRKFYTPAQAQEAIEILNKNLDAFYKNPSYDNARKVTIDAMVANNLRKGLDDAVEKITSSQYQVLKNQYGALKSIEKDVVHRAIVDARKNIKGLIDFSDILSAGQVISGVMTLNPQLIAQGVGQKLIAGFYKKLNDPNRIINNMFKKVEKVADRASSKGLNTRPSVTTPK